MKKIVSIIVVALLVAWIGKSTALTSYQTSVSKHQAALDVALSN